MKLKHNKKRNTAFLYEVLTKELTRSIVDKNDILKAEILSIVKEHFSKGKVLNKEINLYKTLKETKNVERRIAEKIFLEVINVHSSLSKRDIFNEQTRVIEKINKKLGPSVFSSFISDYKSLASISQIFNNQISIKEKILLEENIIQKMTISEEVTPEMKSLDSLAYKTFINKFNNKYSNSLLEEQKDLLTNYLTSFSDNGISLKIFLNEEIGRLKEELNKCLLIEEIKNDKEMFGKTKKIFEKLDLFKQKEFDKEMLSEVLKIQYFISEAQSNDN